MKSILLTAALFFVVLQNAVLGQADWFKSEEWIKPQSQERLEKARRYFPNRKAAAKKIADDIFAEEGSLAPELVFAALYDETGEKSKAKLLVEKAYNQRTNLLSTFVLTGRWAKANGKGKLAARCLAKAKQMAPFDVRVERLANSLKRKGKQRVTLVGPSNTNNASASGRRKALIIGNADYAGDGKLRNPINDAAKMRASLRQLGFDVTLKQNLSLRQLKSAVNEFHDTLTAEDAAFFFFSGHGLQVKNTNFVVPLGSEIESEADIEYECMDVGRIESSLAKAKLLVMVLDCCRNNPFRGLRRSLGQSDLVYAGHREEIPDGRIRFFATAAKVTASDGNGDNSPFTASLTRVLDSRPVDGLELREAIFETGILTKKASGQKPHVEMDVTMDDFFLVPSNQGASASSSQNGSTQGNGNSRPQPSRPTSPRPNSGNQRPSESKLLGQIASRYPSFVSRKHLERWSTLESRISSGNLNSQDRRFIDVYHELFSHPSRLAAQEFVRQYQRVSTTVTNRKLGLKVFGHPIGGTIALSPYGAAFRAGLRDGDVIVNLDGPSDLNPEADTVVAFLLDGDPVTIQVAKKRIPPNRIPSSSVEPTNPRPSGGAQNPAALDRHDSTIWKYFRIKVAKGASGLEVTESKNTAIPVGKLVARFRARGKNNSVRLLSREKLASYLVKYAGDSQVQVGAVGGKWVNANPIGF